ncbi:hypothetical protein BABINDRAFT_159861 [Babjeviella inositovora NRRL Y-12698]|uniref:Uncharacterized protein n=1 Tax=Babjeviella inositovora NRRL Y-12698 TaxID=984486 RepID=A0A1E3QVA8_9ASCO|nr:uncharacterized protein BABINDRAFT_159861 [Babjeviella inositovora NRRL Y-12698]ODQ81589.1 hypothetical protein BABINDRAFT_159861 [Babjeviella inositovora NRRL Y-12698]
MAEPREPIYDQSSPPPASSVINSRDSSPVRGDDDDQPEEESTKRKGEEESDALKKRKGPAPGGKVSAEILQRRKEGRLKAAANMAARLEELGIQRQDKVNDVAQSLIRPISLINQKNYFTDYLKRDEQVLFVRKIREERTAKSSGTAKPKQKEFDIDNFDLNDLVKDDEEDEEDEDEDDDEIDGKSTEALKLEKSGARTIVIHPGTANFRIGLATDVYPKTIPTVIAVASSQKGENEGMPTPHRTLQPDGEIFIDEEFKDVKKQVSKDFRERMRYYKRRILPNSHEQVTNYNKKQQHPEDIPDHNDPHKIEWLTEASLTLQNYIVGLDALKLATYDRFQLRYPLASGNFNNDDSQYQSKEEVLGDLQLILRSALALELDIGASQTSETGETVATPFLQYSILLLIPDLYDKTYCEAWVSLLMQMLFKQVAVIQEAVAATFGAGVLSACVIDIGAKTTKISCVDEGMIHADSRIRLDYGSANITELFVKMLLQSHFPFQDIDLRNPAHWEFADQVKQKFVTFLDGDIAVQLYNFYRRVPSKQAAKLEFKVFDEVMLAPMGLFFPELFQIAGKNTRGASLFPVSTDQYTLKPNNPYSKAQETLLAGAPYAESTEDVILAKLTERDGPVAYAKPKPAHTANVNTSKLLTPLEKAIIESITNACKGDLNKFRKMYENLMLVGGGAKISGFDFILTDRINIWRPRLLSSSALSEILLYVTAEQDKRTARVAEKKKLREEKKKIKDDKEKKVKGEVKVEKADNDDEENPEVVEDDEEDEDELKLDFDLIEEMLEAGTTLPVDVLAPPKDIDPQILSWKGGSVYSRLKIISEMWITREEWDMFGGRCLHYKSLFHY